MVSIAVILLHQWMERERQAYPLAQVGLAMIRGENEKNLVNDFFKRKTMWIGAAIPLLIGTSIALKRYQIPIVPPTLGWKLPFVGDQYLNLRINFALVDFSYLINTRVAASIWIFYLFGKVQKALL